MPPSGGVIGHKSKAYNIGLATQADDAKYKAKYKELRSKITEVEEDNTKLQVKILKSKKAIQRLRIERAILYDRLQSSATPSNPFALHTVPHLSSLPAPPSILDKPPYALAHPDGQSTYLKELDARKLADLKPKGKGTWGTKPKEGVLGEEEDEDEDGDEEEESKAPKTSNGVTNGAGHTAAAPVAGPSAPPPSAPRPTPTSTSDTMQVDP